MSYEKKIQELKKLIKVNLEACDPLDTPEVCRIASNPDDYQGLEDKIIRMIVDAGHTISSAIILIEREYNVNMIDD
jgi:hypothetical protein